MIACSQPISLGTKMSDNKGPPRDITFVKNVITGTAADKTPVRVTTMPEDLKLSGNVCELAEDAKLGLESTEEQFKIVRPGELKLLETRPITADDVRPDSGEQ